MFGHLGVISSVFYEVNQFELLSKVHFWISFLPLVGSNVMFDIVKSDIICITFIRFYFQMLPGSRIPGCNDSCNSRGPPPTLTCQLWSWSAGPPWPLAANTGGELSWRCLASCSSPTWCSCIPHILATKPRASSPLDGEPKQGRWIKKVCCRWCVTLSTTHFIWHIILFDIQKCRPEHSILWQF